MIKRLFWTCIVLSPAILTALLNAIGIGDGDSSLFNAGGALNYSIDAIKEFIDLFNESTRDIWAFIWKCIVAAFLIMPFIFVYRGLFFIGWIPLLGTILRLAALIAVFILPGLLMESSNPDAITVGQYMEASVMIFAFIGIWLPKSITTK